MVGIFPENEAFRTPPHERVAHLPPQLTIPFSVVTTLTTEALESQNKGPGLALGILLGSNGNVHSSHRSFTEPDGTESEGSVLSKYLLGHYFHPDDLDTTLWIWTRRWGDPPPIVGQYLAGRLGRFSAIDALRQVGGKRAELLQLAPGIIDLMIDVQIPDDPQLSAVRYNAELNDLEPVALNYSSG